jgi:hypothetical protein
MKKSNTKKSSKPNAGQFKKGPDPRRHSFTHDECVAGFWSAIDSIVMRYPDAVGPRGHMVVNFLPAVQTRRMLRGR